MATATTYKYEWLLKKTKKKTHTAEEAVGIKSLAAAPDVKELQWPENIKR